MPIVLWILLALVAAAAVLLLAARVESREAEDDDLTPAEAARAARPALVRAWLDMKAGATSLWTVGLRPRPEDRDAGEPNSTVDEFLAAASTSQPAYLDAEQISSLLQNRRSGTVRAPEAGLEEEPAASGAPTDAQGFEGQVLQRAAAPRKVAGHTPSKRAAERH